MITPDRKNTKTPFSSYICSPVSGQNLAKVRSISYTYYFFLYTQACCPKSKRQCSRPSPSIARKTRDKEEAKRFLIVLPSIAANVLGAMILVAVSQSSLRRRSVGLWGKGDVDVSDYWLIVTLGLESFVQADDRILISTVLGLSAMQKNIVHVQDPDSAPDSCQSSHAPAQHQVVVANKVVGNYANVNSEYRIPVDGFCGQNSAEGLQEYLNTVVDVAFVAT
ncbi:uncharacterized protein MYCFIDRAFT_169117 [Pseudocercospora fijiensis CIRAD86]|uniref:Uncharacterized protein n=1 Tax=Pseudocercospora fijiensis (strain CIRAD86) TaxID=383855 RepID=N1Q6Z7_PSEFD|nr:uncharacterized protein MYCFIDRAFT_169117 [Pseudocercospora fijiensis CIRAD86]EME87256.1 hypothetical protein MYCFIDRAFT_169117 [Pseudocercospora fijiensis CIRAD86]